MHAGETAWGLGGASIATNLVEGTAPPPKSHSKNTRARTHLPPCLPLLGGGKPAVLNVAHLSPIDNGMCAGMQGSQVLVAREGIYMAARTRVIFLFFLVRATDAANAAEGVAPLKMSERQSSTTAQGESCRVGMPDCQPLSKQ